MSNLRNLKRKEVIKWVFLFRCPDHWEPQRGAHRNFPFFFLFLSRENSLEGQWNLVKVQDCWASKEVICDICPLNVMAIKSNLMFSIWQSINVMTFMSDGVCLLGKNQLFMSINRRKNTSTVNRKQSLMVGNGLIFASVAASETFALFRKRENGKKEKLRLHKVLHPNLRSFEDRN